MEQRGKESVERKEPFSHPRQKGRTSRGACRKFPKLHELHYAKGGATPFSELGEGKGFLKPEDLKMKTTTQAWLGGTSTMKGS